MRIVLDTNVLVSGLLSPFGPPGEIVRMVSSGTLTLCVDARILSEYDEVLARPRFGFDRDAVAALLDYLSVAGDPAAADPLPVRLPDRDEEPFLEVAIACGAACLVTGNLEHFPAAARAGVEVVSPARFVDGYRSRSAGGKRDHLVGQDPRGTRTSASASTASISVEPARHSTPAVEVNERASPETGHDGDARVDTRRRRGAPES